jgi:signal transduction histidine kinase
VAAAAPGREVRTVREGDLRGSFDADRIAQLAGNLLGNALAYGTPDSPVRVELSGAREVRIAVANRGPKVPPEERARLFLPFQRGSRPGSPRGLGLGLFIVDQIARAHGGRVEVSSDDDDETRFTVTLPRHR